MTAKKIQFPTEPGAIAVSLTLQRTFVSLAAGVSLVQILLLLPDYVFTSVKFSTSTAFSFALSALIPVLYFAIAYAFGPRYPVSINRWFMAVLKATSAVIAAALLQSLVFGFVRLFQIQDGYAGLNDGSWYSLTVLNNAAQLLVLVALVIYALNKRNRV